MNDSTKALLGAMSALLALVACVSIMARCSVDVERTDTAVAECAKAGGHWQYNAGNGFCEERK